MIIECSYCNSKVDAKLMVEKKYPAGEENDPYKITILECPACSTVIVGGSDLVQDRSGEYEWTDPVRLWPDPIEQLSFSIPGPSRKSLEEANRCFRAQAFSACAVMCGRAIEAVCAAYETKSKNLAGGLKELRDKGIIDQRLFEWAEALREQRNIGAHATDKDVSRDDARDVLDFSIAICQYVFVLSEKYEDFKARQAKKAVKKTAAKAR